MQQFFIQPNGEEVLLPINRLLSVVASVGLFVALDVPTGEQPVAAQFKLLHLHHRQTVGHILQDATIVNRPYTLSIL